MSAPTSQFRTWKVATPDALMKSPFIMKRQKNVWLQMNVGVTTMVNLLSLVEKYQQKRTVQNVSVAPQDPLSVHQFQDVLVLSMEQVMKWDKLLQQ